MVMNLRKKWFRFEFVRNVLGLTMVAMMSLGLPGPARADTVELHGGTSVIATVIHPYRADVEKKTGHKLSLVGNGVGPGLVDLIDGKADASLACCSLDVAVAAAEIAGKKVDPKSLQFHEVGKDEVVFIIHPANPVTALSIEQLRDIWLGKITNWKQAGGKDLLITLYAEPATGGTRAFVKKNVMGGSEYLATTKSLISANRIGEMVPNDESGIGFLGKEIANSKSKIVQTNKLGRPLGFITVGAPSAKVKQVIDAFKVANK
jgi:phosphate transport system substrate-binding protein